MKNGKRTLILLASAWFWLGMTGQTLPYSPENVCEKKVYIHGLPTVQAPPDMSFSLGADSRHNCFIVISKKDYYLYVYEKRQPDTVLVARYDCCLAINTGNKKVKGDMRTPHCTRAVPSFSISQIADSHTWRHNFGDGRGNILAYGPWFLRLDIGTSNRSIGIHGSTNNRESVPGRASEGCIRLKDEDLSDLRKRYAFVGMKVIVKAEDVDDYPFEVRAMQVLGEPRLRHFRPKTISPKNKTANEHQRLADERTTDEKRSLPTGVIIR